LRQGIWMMSFIGCALSRRAKDHGMPRRRGQGTQPSVHAGVPSGNRRAQG
jgi:hypothetical protein